MPQMTLQNADRQKDEFLATLAHELRNPLAPLRTGLDLLIGPGCAAVDDARARIMNRQLDHMVRLIDDLLNVSRISRGMLELKKERAQLRACSTTALDPAARSSISASRRSRRRSPAIFAVRRSDARLPDRRQPPPQRCRSTPRTDEISVLLVARGERRGDPGERFRRRHSAASSSTVSSTCSRASILAARTPAGSASGWRCRGISPSCTAER